MHDDDLTDLAMISACFQRLIARAADNAGAASVLVLSDAATVAMTGVSSVLGVSADQVHSRVCELRGRSRPAASVVH
jgi:hypothetical protein